MYTNPQAGKKIHSIAQKNTAETLGESADIFDQLFGEHTAENYQESQAPQQYEHAQPKRKLEKNIFIFANYHEAEVVQREIKELDQKILKEIKSIEKMASETVKDAEKLALESPTAQTGIYHIRLRELIIGFLANIRAKVGESRTWMNALISKKKKRGSLFAARTKEKGTQYSM